MKTQQAWVFLLNRGVHSLAAQPNAMCLLFDVFVFSALFVSSLFLLLSFRFDSFFFQRVGAAQGQVPCNESYVHLWPLFEHLSMGQPSHPPTPGTTLNTAFQPGGARRQIGDNFVFSCLLYPLTTGCASRPFFGGGCGSARLISSYIFSFLSFSLLLSYSHPLFP